METNWIKKIFKKQKEPVETIIKCDKCNVGNIKHKKKGSIGFSYDICDSCYSTWDNNGVYLGIPTKKVLGLSYDNSIIFDYKD
jgi:ssDNA-binding Zn-finger/Zn-ribbon topoisomerase 1